MNQLIDTSSALMSAINGLHRPAFESMTQELVNPENYKLLHIYAQILEL